MPYLRPEAVAESMSLETSLVKYWLRQRLLRHVKIGHQWLIHSDDLADFIDRHTVEPEDRVGVTADGGQ